LIVFSYLSIVHPIIILVIFLFLSFMLKHFCAPCSFPSLSLHPLSSIILYSFSSPFICYIILQYITYITLHCITLHYTTCPGSEVRQNDCRMWNMSYKYLLLHQYIHMLTTAHWVFSEHESNWLLFICRCLVVLMLIEAKFLAWSILFFIMTPSS
jgi:hypothetical protein